MDTNAVLDIGLDALVLAGKLAAPVLITALVVGFAISLIQSITQIQEVTLSFVPKAIAVAVALLVAGHWMISELKRAFEIGFLLFLPFLIIDLVVASVLMSMGMMMLPPVMISLPFKILLFVLVDGWGLIITTLITSYRGG